MKEQTLGERAARARLDEGLKRLDATLDTLKRVFAADHPTCEAREALASCAIAVVTQAAILDAFRLERDPRWRAGTER